MRLFRRRPYLPPFTAAMYDGPLPEEWIETVALNLDTYLRAPGPGSAFSLGVTVGAVAQESDHSAETLMRYIARDVSAAGDLDVEQEVVLHNLVADLDPR